MNKIEHAVENNPVYNIYTLSGNLVVNNGLCSSQESGNSNLVRTIRKALIFCLENIKKGSSSWCYKNVYQKIENLTGIVNWMNKKAFNVWYFICAIICFIKFLCWKIFIFVRLNWEKNVTVNKILFPLI